MSTLSKSPMMSSLSTLSSMTSSPVTSSELSPVPGTSGIGMKCKMPPISLFFKKEPTGENLKDDEIPDDWLLGMDDALKEEQLVETTDAKEPDVGNQSDTMKLKELPVDGGKPKPGFSAHEKGDEEDKTGADDR